MKHSIGFFLRESLRAMRRNAAPSFAALATITVTLIVVGVFIPIVQATTGAANSAADKVMVDVYMKDSATAADNARVMKELRAIPHVSEGRVRVQAAGAGAAEEGQSARLPDPRRRQPAAGHVPRLSAEPWLRARDPLGHPRCRRQRPPARYIDLQGLQPHRGHEQAADRDALRHDHRRSARGAADRRPRYC